MQLRLRPYHPECVQSCLKKHAIVCYSIIFLGLYNYLRASLVPQMVKNLPAMQRTQIRSLGWEDPLEKGMTGYCLQYSCLETSMDRGTWRATVHGVAKSQTRLSN